MTLSEAIEAVKFHANLLEKGGLPTEPDGLIAAFSLVIEAANRAKPKRISKAEIDPFEWAFSKCIPVTESGCWIWLGSINGCGYANAQIDNKYVGVHRWLYEKKYGPITKGLLLDHLCRVRCCINPEHLEPVTNMVNLARGNSPTAINSRKTHCPRGHPYDKIEMLPTGRPGRKCTKCTRAAGRKNYYKKKAAAVQKPLPT